MQKMSNGDYFDEKMRSGDRSKEARRISPSLKLLLKSPKFRCSTAPKSAHLHRGREQGDVLDKENISGFQEEVLWSGVLSAARAASDGPSGKLQTFPPSNACQRE